MSAEKDVKLSEASSTSEQEGEVTPEQVEDTTTATSQQETTETSQESRIGEGKSQPIIEAVDEQGVPWKNRAMEWQRKFQEIASDDFIERITQRIQEQLKQPVNQQEQEYSVAQLEAFALEHPQYRPWVEEQKLKILQKQLLKATEEKVKETEEKRLAEQKRRDAFQYVVQNYPECFIKDAFGNLNWNLQHPLTQQIGLLMQDKRFASDPEGLIAAADIAYARLVRAKAPKTIKTLQKNLKKEQQKTLVEGGTSKEDVIKRKTNYEKAMEVFRATGSKDALIMALKEKMKSKSEEEVE